MKKVLVTGLRIIFGLMFLLYGIDGFWHFLPPYPMSDKAAAFVSALIDTGYLWPIMKATQIVCGVLLLIDLFVPLALVILAPVVLNIFCMHLFINPAGLPMGILVSALELALAWFYRDSFKGILSPKAVVDDLVERKEKSSVTG